jgi:NADPH:quinone reductase
MHERMKAAFYQETGAAAQVLKVGELESAPPGPGEVRVRVRTSGVNPSDVKSRSGRTRRTLSFPQVIPHSDGAGEIDAVGAGVPASRVGERVWLHNGQYKRPFGTAAKYVTLPAELAQPLPKNVDYAVGACIGIPLLTAWFAITRDGPVEGQTVLVAGGAGAVGHYAVQVARMKGARVLTTVSSREKAAHAKAAGADHVIDYRSENVEERVREIAPGGVDRVIEVNLSSNAGLDARVLKPFGKCVVYGSDEEIAPVPARMSISNSFSWNFFVVYEVPLAERLRAIAELTPLLAAGRFTHTIAARYPLERIVAAHEAVESGRVMGNVVVDLP